MLLLHGIFNLYWLYIFLELFQNLKFIMQELQKGGQNVALRSQHKELIPGTSIYLADTLGIEHLVPFHFSLIFP